MGAGADLMAAVCDPLRAAGLRVATEMDDVVPPTLWLVPEALTETGTLADPIVVTYALYWIPVRGLGVGSTERNTDAMIDATRALAGVKSDPVSWSTVTLTMEPASQTGPWLAYRTPVVVAAAIID
jgi:hypothetical protein